MTKRVIAIILSAIMFLSVVPVSASAAGFTPMSIMSDAANVAESVVESQVSKDSSSGGGFFEKLFNALGLLNIKNESTLIKKAKKNSSFTYTITKDITLGSTVSVTGKLKLKGSKTITGSFVVKKNATLELHGNLSVKTDVKGTPVILCEENSETAIDCDTINNPNNTDLEIKGPNAKVYFNGKQINDVYLCDTCVLYMYNGYIGTLTKEKGGTLVQTGGKIYKIIEVPVPPNIITQADAVNWITNKANGKWWGDVDGYYGCQCVDLIMAYYEYLVGYRVAGNACDYLSNTLPSGWYRDNKPSPGSIIVWGGNTWTGQWTTGSKGHVGLVYSVSGSDVFTVETNTGGSSGSGSAAVAVYKTRKNVNATYIHPNFPISK